MNNIDCSDSGKYSLLFFLAISVIFYSCQTQKQEEARVAVTEPGEPVQYEATLKPLNKSLNENQNISGKAVLEVTDNKLLVSMRVEGLPPNMMHLQHLHGFETGKPAGCPPETDADKNNDGYVDLMETNEYAGVTMIPLHDNPLSLEIKTETYPKADSTGSYAYLASVSLDSLNAAVKNQFNLDTLNFRNLVLFIHGVNPDKELPKSVQSLPGVPATVTIPVACGKLEKATQEEDEMAREGE